MKIAVTGKGGVGKTTFAATLARLYADEGRKVLAADVDPDANLGLALGFDDEPWILLFLLQRCGSWWKNVPGPMRKISSTGSIPR